MGEVELRGPLDHARGVTVIGNELKKLHQQY